MVKAKYNNIAVIYGSDSAEWEVSCSSGEFTALHIDDTKYNIYEIFARFGQWNLVAFRNKNSMRVTLPEEARPKVDKNDFSINLYGEKIKFDFAYVMQHGKPGESGQLQGYFEMLNIPYSSCSSFVSAIVFDKYSCKTYLQDVDFVKLSPGAFIRRGEDVSKFSEKTLAKLGLPVFVKPTDGGSSFGVTKVKQAEDLPSAINFAFSQGEDVSKFSEKTLAKLGLPVFVKPTDGGSSFGVTKVKQAEDLPSAINFAFSQGDTVIVEKAIKGRELTCAAYIDSGKVVSLPVIEIITENEYFDYDAKYNGHSREVCPAEISKELTDLVKETTEKIYKYLGCKGLVRIDYISAEDGLYFLEVNNIPGMTSASLVPKMLRAAGLDVTAFLNTIIDNS